MTIEDLRELLLSIAEEDAIISTLFTQEGGIPELFKKFI